MEEADNPLDGYFSSILELVSVDRMDKALLEAAPKDSLPDYRSSKLFTSVIIAMPQPRRYSLAGTQKTCSLELEFGVHECPYPKDLLLRD